MLLLLLTAMLMSVLVPTKSDISKPGFDIILLSCSNKLDESFENCFLDKQLSKVVVAAPSILQIDTSGFLPDSLFVSP